MSYLYKWRNPVQTMKLFSKIAIVLGLIAFASSCQKENNIAPDCPTRDINSANERRLNPLGNESNSGSMVTDENVDSDSEDVIGGGDDDRDGGGGKKIKKGGG